MEDAGSGRQSRRLRDVIKTASGFVSLLWHYRWWWIVPMAVMAAFFLLLLTLADSTGDAPFIYTLF